MNAKYPLTEVLSSYVKGLREHKINCTVEEFADIIGHTKSWGSNLLKNKMKDISLEDLWFIFRADYNYRMFIKRKQRMIELIEEGFNSHYLNKKDFDEIFGGKVPAKTFKGNCCIIPEDYIIKGHKEVVGTMFSEDKFPEEDRYIFITFEDRYKLEKKQRERFEAFIIETLDEIIKTHTAYGLRNEYWLFAMYLMFKEIDKLPKPLWERIKYICFNDEYMRQNTEFKWRHIYSVLGENRSLRTPSYYTIRNVVYFDNPQEPMSSSNFPAFNVRYDIEEMQTTRSDEDDYFELKLEDGVSGKIKLLDLFMILHRGNYHSSVKKDNEQIFRETCVELAYYKIDTPFSHLDFLNIPVIEEKTEDLKFFDFMKMIFDFDEDLKAITPENEKYKLIEKYQNNQSIMQFKKNIMTGRQRFLNVISFDFSFIENLPEIKDKELHQKLEEIVDDFKKKNLI